LPLPPNAFRVVARDTATADANMGAAFTMLRRVRCAPRFSRLFVTFVPYGLMTSPSRTLGDDIDYRSCQGLSGAAPVGIVAVPPVGHSRQFLRTRRLFVDAGISQRRSYQFFAGTGRFRLIWLTSFRQPDSLPSVRRSSPPIESN
jgi:hypothetical protein